MPRTLRRSAVSFLLLVPLLAVSIGPAEAQRAGQAPPDGIGAAEPQVADTLLEQLRIEHADLDTIDAGLLDFGKLWTFEHPPAEYIESTYGFRPDSAWFRHARLGALRIPSCSASFVSPRGLILTNDHCARDAVAEVTREGEHLVEDGFFARDLAEERRTESYHADQLREIVDVTDRIYGALEGVEGEEARAELRDSLTDAVGDSIAEARGGEKADVVVEVIALYQGARYSAYVFHRYDDVRVVLVPELDVAAFGGDPDNFTYPRYSLDFSLLRVYDDQGEPLRVDDYFPWNPDGMVPGDPIFIVGNPGSTSRLQTVAQLLFRRDVADRATLDFVRRRTDAYRTYLDEEPDADPTGALKNTLLELENSRKAYQGMLDGLGDRHIMARKLDLELQLRDSIRADSGLSAAYGDLFDEIAEIQTEKRAMAPEFNAFLGMTAEDYEAAVLQRALWALQWLIVQRQGGAREDLEGLALTMDSVPSQPEALQELLVAARLREYVAAYGQDDDMVQRILGGRSAEVAAAALVQGSVLADSAAAAAALENGSLSPSDPGLQLMIAIIQRFVTWQQELSTLQSREEELNADVGRARFEIYGTEVPPDATFSLRITDGVVRGYPYNGTLAPPLTTYWGLWDHYHSYRGSDEASEWDLPERWLSPPESFDRSTPLNFVATADIVGGNSGSPVLDRDLHVVGVVFDGNIESLPGDYIYLSDTNRAVAVDGRGILEAIEEIYGADRILHELLTGELVRTEEEAEAMGSSGR